MADQTPSRFGSINGGTDKTALFLKVFSGQVLATFRKATIFLEKHTVRTISSGKSAQFPVIGTTGSFYHTPGAEILGSAIAEAEQVISIDGFLISPVFMADIDLAMTHFDVRSEYATQCGLALSYAFDSHVAQTIVLASRASAAITGGNGGTKVTASTARTSGDALAQAIADANEALAEKNVPAGDRWAAVTPKQYNLLVNSTTKLVNRDYNQDSANGGVGSGVVESVSGIPIVMTNQMPSTNVTTGPAAYQGDFTNTAALVWARPAVGTVKLVDLSTRTDYDARRMGWQTVARYSMGHGILRPECAVEIAVA